MAKECGRATCFLSCENRLSHPARIFKRPNSRAAGGAVFPQRDGACDSKERCFFFSGLGRGRSDRGSRPRIVGGLLKNSISCSMRDDSLPSWRRTNVTRYAPNGAPLPIHFGQIRCALGAEGFFSPTASHRLKAAPAKLSTPRPLRSDLSPFHQPRGPDPDSGDRV